MLLVASAALGQEDPDYPLGRLGLPPVMSPADPFRLADLAFGFTEDGATVSRFESRVKLGARAFVGTEVRGERLGLSFDTQRLELGVSEDDGRVGLEGAYRAARLLFGVDAARRRDDTWNLEGRGAIRLSPDWELTLRYQHDTDASRGGPPSLEEFIETGAVPAPSRAGRSLRSGALGFSYQRQNDLEVESDASWSRFRTAAGFDQTRARISGRGLWSHSRAQLDGGAHAERIEGRLARSEARTELGGALKIGAHWVARARTVQAWQPGVERFTREYRAGVTFYGKRFQFARASRIAEEVFRLTRIAYERGYNERREYDREGLRSLRDRLSLAPSTDPLVAEVNALYRAQVSERNVPQLGIEVASLADEIAGSESVLARAFVGIPWRLAWPFSRGEDRVDFLSLDYTLREDDYPSLGLKAHSHAASLRVELDRQQELRLLWESPAQSPQDRAFQILRGRRLSVDYVYALGR